jgi:hypothetical protein
MTDELHDHYYIAAEGTYRLLQEGGYPTFDAALDAAEALNEPATILHVWCGDGDCAAETIGNGRAPRPEAAPDDCCRVFP